MIIRMGDMVQGSYAFSIMIKRVPSKKSLSLHKQANIKQQLRSIDNLQLTSENILEKLLNPANEKKLAVESRKYNPKFEKKDYQTIAQQNQNLKAELREERQNVTSLRFKVGEYQRKVKFLQGIQQKWEGAMREGEEEARRQPVYTDILKKKIQELNELYLASEEKIKELKQLPHVSVFEQASVQKEYLTKETIRLKAVIAALPEEEEKIQNKFMKFNKEENEKLKSIIRLHQNDKNLLKSRQILQKRQIADSRKEIEQLKAALITKDTQIQAMANDYKNMIFKKAQQFANDQKKKENQEYDTLKKSHDALQDSLHQLQLDRDSLLTELDKLRKNEKINETKKNTEDKEKTDLRIDNNRLRKLVEGLREQLDRQKENAKLIESQNKKKRREKKLLTNTAKVEQYPPVKFEDIELALITLAHHVESGLILSDLFDEEELRCGRLIDIFAEEPLGLERTQATKLARYIVEGNTAKWVVYDERAMATKSLCVMILKAALSKLQECRCPDNEDRWHCILAKSKKLMPELERMGVEVISKEQLLGVLSKHINESFDSYITYALLQSFDLQTSESEVMINVSKILVFFEHMQTHKTAR